MSYRPCQRDGCGEQAGGVLALQFFPHKALMILHNKHEQITHIIVDIELCEKHKDEVKPRAFLDPKLLESMVRMVEKASGITVDQMATKAALVPFDHPDVVVLRSRRK